MACEEPHRAMAARECEARPLGGARGGRGSRRAGELWPPGGLWRAAAAEAVGTALLVLLSCLPGCGAEPAPLAVRALAGGLVVAALVQCFDHVSGAMLNPCVSLAAVLAGRMRAAPGLALGAAQLAGGALGAALLGALAPPAPPALARCLTLPASTVTPYQAVAIEAVLGAMLALLNLSSWDARTRLYKDSWPLRVGAAVAALGFAAGELTGASGNPARSSGPALLAARPQALWVYWVGPLGGSALACALHAAVWRAPAAAPAPLAPLAPPAPLAPLAPLPPPLKLSV